jgi:opacity protein-like surface antigen
LTGTLNNATAGSDEAVNKGLSGWTGGGGVAYAFAQNWNVFAEYRYTRDVNNLASVVATDDNNDNDCECR